jgi:Lrp/AsnC family transcriptional regulator
MHMTDAIDLKILKALQFDADLSVADLGKRAGVSSAVVTRRIAALEGSGVIKGWSVDLDPKALGYEVSVSLRITLDKTARRAFDEFIEAARDVSEVDAIQTLLGRVDVRLNVLARDLAHYQEIYRDKILALPHVLDIEALMLISDVKTTHELPL